MTLAANQPYFLPYLPYWQLIDSADVFLVSDDYAFMKASWICRNRILVAGRVQYFRVEVSGASCHRLISDMQMAPWRADEKLRTLEMAYHKAPCFREGYGLAERILLGGGENLCSFLTASIREVCDYLGVSTRIRFTSDLPGNALLRREERIYDMCRQLGADRYVNAIGGRSLYSFGEFRSRGIDLCFLHSEVPAYRQLSDSFVPGLSVIDAIMNVPRGQLREMLDKRTLLYE